MNAVRHVIPVAAPGLICALLFAFTLSWNEFIYALTFTSAADQKTITVGITNDLIRGDIYYCGSLMAGAVLGSVPIVILYVFFLDYYISGLTSGAVKLRVLKTVDRTDMQGRYSGMTEICYERTTKPGRIPRVSKLCQSGKLYAIRDWISAGKSFRTALETKKTLLSVGIKTGFHSLVELIAPHETLEAKNHALADAVRQKRCERL